jgi:ribonuclease HI
MSINNEEEINQEKPAKLSKRKRKRNSEKSAAKIEKARLRRERKQQYELQKATYKAQLTVPDIDIDPPLIISFDGGSRGNPGPAAAGAVLALPTNESVTMSRFLPRATNNEAEYMGAIIGLEKALELGATNIILQGDSQLVINQLEGVWEVNAGHLLNYFGDAKRLLRQFKTARLQWIPRQENKLADAACNAAMDEATGVKAEREKLAVLPSVTPVEKLAKPIERLIRLDKKAGFKDFMKLKSGSDTFSKVKLPKLAEEIPEVVKEAIVSVWADIDEATLAKVYRWYLRGLPAHLAVRKVRVDLEIAQNMRGSR